MRGKRLGGVTVVAVTGLIPAHAGKTVAEEVHNLVMRAHPRACGENSRLPSLSRPRTGSSPRMRGKLSRPSISPTLTGLIPAHAGKTDSFQRRRASSAAHPRACGENETQPRTRGGRAGSSPRMRGKQDWISWVIRWSGLIPAHAGKTPGSLPCGGAGLAHPRACGENRGRGR